MHLQLSLPFSAARILGLAAVALLLAKPTFAWAHPGLDERIAQVTAQLAANPQDVDLLLTRAELRRLHGQFDAALSDLHAAALVNPDASMILLSQARIFSDAGQPTNALALVLTRQVLPVQQARHRHPPPPLAQQVQQQDDREG